MTTLTSDRGVAPHEHREGYVTEQIERYTSQVPSGDIPDPGGRLDRPFADLASPRAQA